MDDQRAAIPGSDVTHGEEACWSPAPREMKLEVTIYIRPPENAPSAELLSGQFQPMSREEAETKFSAKREDLEAIRTFADEHGLRVKAEDQTARTVHVEGTVEQLGSAFGVNIGALKSGDQTYISYQGCLTVPAPLQNVVSAVLGLDRRPIAKAHQ